MTDRRDPLADEEADAAAAEAGKIGGQPTRDLEADMDIDESMRPVYESGGGDAEGFELAEEELREHAEHGPAKPETQVRVREEVDRETEEDIRGVYGEADHVEVTEVGHDPDPDRRDDESPGAIDPHTSADNR